jgi:hypothetical protein
VSRMPGDFCDMSARSRRRAFEPGSRARLERCGDFVIRSAGSKTPLDLVAIKPDERPVFVQYEGCARGLSRRERIELIDFAADAGATPVLRKRGLEFSFLAEVA